MRQQTETATIEAEREDAWTDEGHNPVNPVIVSPAGKLPTGAWEQVTDAVQDEYDVTDFAFDGQRITAGTITYEPTKDGDIVEINV